VWLRLRSQSKLPLPIIPGPGQPCLGDLFVFLGRAKSHADGAHHLALPRVPNGRIPGPLGEFPILTGKLAQLTRIFHGALPSGAESTLASGPIRSKCVVCSGLAGCVRLVPVSAG
jgi:hypothetical protein